MTASHCWRPCVCALAIWWCALPAFAADSSGRSRTTLNITDGVWVGQRITLVIELLAPGSFAGTPVFDLPQVANVLIFPPADRPVLGTEESDGVSYTVQRYELGILARRAGAYDIPPFAVRFAFKPQPLDRNVVPQTAMTERLRFNVKLPPGAETLGLIISSRALTVEESWQPEVDQAKTGDALVRTIVFSAPDIPGMAFPPFPASAVAGFGVYPQDPEVLDHSERGEWHGQRRETITYVCERTGHLIIPGTRVTWWNVQDQQLETIDLPERVLDVVPNPTLPAPSAAEDYAIGRRWLVMLAAAALTLAAVGFIVFCRRLWSQVASYFQPVHLQPLNPGCAIEERLQRAAPD